MSRLYPSVSMSISRAPKADSDRPMKWVRERLTAIFSSCSCAVALMTTNQLPEAAFPISFGEQIRDGVGFGLGFDVCTKKSQFDRARVVRDFGWGGAASTHYWVNPADKLIVVTELGNGRYNLDNVNLFMVGYWEVTVRVLLPDQSEDSVMFEFCMDS